MPVAFLSPVTNGSVCCSNKCRDSAQLIATRTPTPGSTVGVTTNPITITFRRKQRLVSFRVTINGRLVAGTLSVQPGGFGTVFTFTPTTAIPVGSAQALITTVDVKRRCEILGNWGWIVTS